MDSTLPIHGSFVPVAAGASIAPHLRVEACISLSWLAKGYTALLAPLARWTAYTAQKKADDAAAIAGLPWEVFNESSESDTS